MSMTHEPLRYAHDEGHTDVCYSEDGKKFITCGSDGDIRIWSTEESEDPVHNCIGEWALCVRQKGNKLYVATGSNDIQILTLPDGDRDGVLDRFTAPINHIAISKNGKYIALAAEEMEVKLINMERENKEVLVLDGLMGPCFSVAISPDCKYVAASSGDGKLRIWEIQTQNLVKDIECFPKVNSFANAKILCRMDFEPTKGKHLAYPDETTIVVVDTKDFSQVATLSCDEVNSSYSLVQYSPCGKFLLATTEEGDFVLFEVETEIVSNISKHPKSIAISGIMWNPNGNGQVVYTDVEGQLGIISDCINENTNKDPENEKVDDFGDNEVDFGDVQFEDDDDDNENAISVEKLKKEVMGELEPELQNLNEDSSHAPSLRARTPEVPLQGAFMPSSTPDHLDPRYLCWNHVGVIRSYGLNSNDESASKSIEVEFHDTTFHSSMMMQNYQEYTMGSLSTGALAVANSSQLNVIPLSATSKEWMLRMEEFEEIILIATSENLICLGMANYLIRICSIYGVQRAVISIPGPLVSMSAYKNLLLVAYHTGGVRKDDQCVGFKLVKFEGTSVDSRDIGSALGPGATLQWLGFSDVGTPGMMDSLGMLSMYPPTCNIWIPYCDSTRHRKALSDGFFVTTIFESYKAVGGIKCKGSMYPGFTPRPTMCELPLEPPYAEPTTDKTQMESQLFVYSTLQIGQDSDKKYKETALKTFALACKNNLDERAMEFMEIINNPQILTLGIKYASKLEKRRLVEKLMSLAQQISNDDDMLDVGSISTPDTSAIKPAVYRKLKLSTSRVTPKSKTLPKAVSTPTQATEDTDVLTPNNTANTTTSIMDTQESVFTSEEEPKNPFLKSLKKDKKPQTENPLSLTDKYAGVNYEKENKTKNTDTGEKRKLSDSSDSEKPQKEKQRKLDMFKFTSNRS
ncbi:unnamed protein product [Brassicogethes aeneus]|uniref:Minichromosome loss protein Mcl1 middle region domain-containing protein n=1 Tax=Brassicogethes aeneus TaxID=1431903 RepID=A0A9P0B2T4_BRAAE|nr:unnamed protein product [Brassicogethes aeneus]